MSVDQNCRSWRIGDKEYDYVKQVLDSGFPGSSKVNFTGRLESEFAKKFNCAYAISFANGTATLHAALVAAGVKSGDEVIVPPLTMASTSLAVIHAGAVPVFADIDKCTLTIDPASIAKKITNRTKAIMPVSLYGLSPDMNPIMELAGQHKLKVIEDDAQCFLGYYKNKIVGSIGHMSSFSFQNSKHMTCGEGGMVTTNDETFAQELRRFSSLGYGLVSAKPGQSKIDKKSLVKPTFKRHISVGYNYRLSELCSAVLMAQLERLDEFVSWRKRSAMAFDEVVKANCSWLHPQRTPAGYGHSYWAYTVVMDDSLDLNFWDQFYDKFTQFGGEGFYGAWSLTYLEPIFQNDTFGTYESGICPNAEFVQPRIMQFKTNYGDRGKINEQCRALEKTIRYFK